MDYLQKIGKMIKTIIGHIIEFPFVLPDLGSKFWHYKNPEKIYLVFRVRWSTVLNRTIVFYATPENVDKLILDVTKYTSTVWGAILCDDYWKSKGITVVNPYGVPIEKIPTSQEVTVFARTLPNFRGKVPVSPVKKVTRFIEA